MKLLFILLLLVSCSNSPKFKVGQCIESDDGIILVILGINETEYLWKIISFRNMEYNNEVVRASVFKDVEENKDGYGKSHTPFIVTCPYIK